jgi:hypothetical protein
VKFAGVPAGTLPHDEDLLRTINHGLTGTSMPAWRLLAEEDKLAIVAYIKTFSEVWQKEAPGPTIQIKSDPWRKKPEKGVAEGEKLYHGLAACMSCHPAYIEEAEDRRVDEVVRHPLHHVPRERSTTAREGQRVGRSHPPAGFPRRPTPRAAPRAKTSCA